MQYLPTNAPRATFKLTDGSIFFGLQRNGNSPHLLKVNQAGLWRVLNWPDNMPNPYLCSADLSHNDAFELGDWMDGIDAQLRMKAPLNGRQRHLVAMPALGTRSGAVLRCVSWCACMTFPRHEHGSYHTSHLCRTAQRHGPLGL